MFRDHISKLLSTYQKWKREKHIQREGEGETAGAGFEDLEAKCVAALDRNV